MEEWVADRNTLESTAVILFNNIIAVLNQKKVSSQVLETALKPFAVTQWNKSILDKIGIAKMNRLLGRLKRSPVPKPALRLVIDHLHEAIEDRGVTLPHRLTDWLTVITKYSLNTLAAYHTWIPAIEILEDKQITTPVSLSCLTLSDFGEIAIGSPHADLLNSLYQAVRIEYVSHTGVTRLALRFREENFSLARELSAENVEESGFGAELANSKEALGLPDNYENLGPIARITALQNTTPESQKLLRFLSAGAQANILAQAKSTLPQVADGVNCYLSFCTLLGIAPFPPTVAGVARWSAIFRPGETYSLYLGHLSKACRLMAIDLSWKTDVITALAHGLKNKGRRTASFHSTLTPEILDKIAKLETWESELARLCYVAFLFTLRLPSEALLLTRALPNERLLSDEVPPNKAVIGLREFQGANRLIVKLSHSKNTRDTYTAMRPCFRGDNALLPRHNCPIHRFWTAVLRHTEPGSPLFPSLMARNFSRVLRAVQGKLSIPDSERYSSHCFRKGDANAIMRSGPTLSEIMRTGGWKSSAFRVYLDLHKAEELSMKDVLGGESSSSASPSSGEETSSFSTAILGREKTIRRAHVIVV